jgi:hypothetical protein
MRSWLAGFRGPAQRAEDAPSLAVWAYRLGLGLLLLGVLCRLHVYCLSFPIWRDEASLALNIVDRDFHGLLGELENFQVAPLLFLWIEKAVCQYLGSSPDLLRLAPLLAGVSALLLFWHLTRRCLAPLPAALALGCLAVAQAPIHLAATIKPYSFDLFTATLLLTLAVRYLQTPERLGNLIALALLIPFVVAASYPAIFVAAALSLVLLPVVWKYGGRAGRCWLVALNVLGGAAFALHLQLVGHEGHDPSLPDVQAYMAGFWQGGFPPRQPLAALGWLVRCHVGHLLSYPLELPGSGLLGLLLAAAGARALYRQRRLDLLGLCLLPFALNFAASVLHRYPYAGGDQRIEQHLAPGICLLLGSGIADFIQRLPAGRRLAMAGVACLLVLLALIAAVGDALRPYQNVEALWARDVGRHLRREVRLEDRIFLPQSTRFTLVCLRWQLLPFAAQVCYNDLERLRRERAAGRWWLVDQTLERFSPLEEPAGREVAKRVPVLTQEHWHDVQRVRFLVREPTSCPQQVYCFCCDLHILERNVSQALSKRY